MKKISIIILFWAIVTSGKAQIRTEVRPTEVLLYLRGAKVHSIANVAVKKGKNRIVIINLPNCLDENSYKIGLSKGCSLYTFTPDIKKIEHKIEPLKKAEYSQSFIDSVYRIYDNGIQKNRTKIAELEKNLDFIKDLISTNKILSKKEDKIDKDDKNYFVQNLNGLIEIYEAKTVKYRNEMEQCNTKIEELSSQKEAWTRKFYPPQIPKDIEPSKPDLLTKELIIELNATADQMAEIELSYFVNNASWIPSYDLKVEDINKPMEIIYKAKIYQNTGQDWDNVRMKVSAYLPRSIQNRPILSNLFVKYSVALPAPAYESLKEDYNMKITSNAVLEKRPSKTIASKKLKEEYASYGDGVKDANSFDVPTANISQEQLNVEYVLNEKQAIPFGDLGSNVILTNAVASAESKYYWIPKLTKEVYLMAWLKNWNTYNFLDGEANIYFKDNYVGQTNIQTNFSGDKFPISLGVDDRIVTKRIETKNSEKINEKKGLKTENVSYEFTVKNNTNNDIKMDIYDQFPVSESEQIKLDKLSYGTALYTPETGRLYWDIALNKGMSEKLNMGYSITYPIEGVINFYNR